MNKLVKLTRPAEVYARLSRLVMRLEAGAQMPSYNKLRQELRVPQRSLDMAYEELRQIGAIEARSRDGVYVCNPYADASVLFIVSAGSLRPESGSGVRQQYIVTRQHLQEYFPGASLEMLVTDRTEPVEREQYIRHRVDLLNRHLRVIGLISTYHVRERASLSFFRRLGVPLLDRDNDLNPHTAKVGWLDESMRLGIEHLRGEGWKDVAVATVLFYDSGVDIADAVAQRRSELAKAYPGVAFHPVPVPHEGDCVQAGADMVKSWLAAGGLPQALVVTDDYLCRGLLAGAQTAGVDLAARCALVVAENEGVPVRASRELTRIELPQNAVAVEQLRFMKRILKGERNVRGPEVAPRLVVGQTSHRSDYPAH